MDKVSGSIVLEAILDGTTLACSLRSGGNVLKQTYNSGTDKWVPDYTALAQGKQPFLYPFIVDTSNADAKSPTKTIFSYNGVKVVTVTDNLTESAVWETGFDPSNPSNTSAKFEVFVHTFSYNNKQVSVPALRIVKNLAATDNVDNDLFECNGTVELEGSQVVFDGLHETFTIEEATGNQFAVWITASNEGMITSSKNSVTLKANISVDGIPTPLSQLTGKKIVWSKLGFTAEKDDANNSSFPTVESSSNDSITINATQVDSMLVVKAELAENTSPYEVVASNAISIMDMTDPYEIAWSVSQVGDAPVQGYQLKKDAVARIRARVVSRATGVEDSSYGILYCFRNVSDHLFKLSGSSNNTYKFGTSAENKYVDVKFADVHAAGRHLSIYATASTDNNILNTLADQLNAQASVQDKS